MLQQFRPMLRCERPEPGRRLRAVTDISDVAERGHRTAFGLENGVSARDLTKVHSLARAIRAGSVWINRYQAMDPAVPFGGDQMSGYGCESGRQHVEADLNVKSVWLRTG